MSNIAELDEHDEQPVVEKKKEQKKKKKTKDKDGNEVEEKEPVEAYKLLGLEEKGYDATPEEIKKAFRKLSLMYHPDKCAANGIEPEDAEEKYKEIQEAHDILTTPDLKCLFDSDVKNLPKNFDRIPTGEEDGDFYETYGEPFQRFSRWSETKPVPQLGDANTPIEEVDAFYDFWFEFKSWRVQTGNPKDEGDGEHDPENAEDAYERRWMKTQNEAERKKLKKVHVKTIATLRDLAFRRDPRVAKAKAADFAKVEAEKQAKLAAKLAKEAEAKAKADAGKSPKELAAEAAVLEAKKAKEAEADAAKAAKEAEADSAEAQAAKVQAAILARQKKMKDAKAAAPKKKTDKKDDKKKKDKKK